MIRITTFAVICTAIGLSDRPERSGPDRPPASRQASWADVVPAAHATGNTSSANRLVRTTMVVAGEHSASRTYVVGDRGLIFISEDGDPDWLIGETPTHRLLTGVTSPDEKHAWAVGHDAIILFSSDGGLTWAEQFSAPDEEAPLFGVWFDDPNRGIAFGAYGLIVETSDGGKNWSQRTIDEEGPHHYALSESPAGSLYVAGEFGSIFRSGDRGHTWNKLPSPYAGTFFGVLALQDESVLVFGLRGKLFRSEDAGETWSRIETGTLGSLLGGTQLRDGRVLIVGLNGTTLQSRDGRTFESTPRQNRLGHSTLFETPEQTLLCGEGGVRNWSP